MQKFFYLILLLLAAACQRTPVPEPDPDPEPETIPAGTHVIPASGQRSGEADAGYIYLTTGAYISSGIPLQIYKTVYGNVSTNELGRSGENANIAYDYTAVTAPNGVQVVSANCLQCHAQKLNNTLVVGLGNSLSDFTTDQSTQVANLDLAVKFIYGNHSPEWEAYAPFRRAILAVGPELVTPVRGVNPADKLAAVLAAHRNQTDLVWRDTPGLTIPAGVVPTDVPAWWLMKKKNAMFYTATGRGDMARFMMASSLLTLTDTAEAREVDRHFTDVMAYIQSIEPPVYPENIDPVLAAKGKEIFTQTCRGCHGTYGDSVSYPNLRVELATIGTDPLLSSSNYSESAFIAWYNGSWFGKNPNQAQLVAEGGYIAPPLDGIWATAPYLHNGSVPDLETLLNSSARPTYWRRTFDNSDYNYETIGWNYTAETNQTDSKTYNTTLEGYGNQGHTFGDVLSEADRKALIEYLKGI